MPQWNSSFINYIHTAGQLFSHEFIFMIYFVQVSIDIPFAFRAIPTESIESTGSQVLGQILKAMLPRFMSQVCD